jgi:alcohol dehydrogenase class IV
MNARFHMPTEVRFGVDALDGLSGARELGSRPVILCGSASAKRHGHLSAVVERLAAPNILDGFPENPSFADCESFAARCDDADLIIALGGGSVIDGAKALALLSANGGRCRDYLNTAAKNAPLPVIAIPTTSGTGSEVTPYSVLIDEQANRKSTLKSPGLFPRLALLDPALTVTLPTQITLATALDALSQAMEGMLSKNATPMGDVLALEACRLVHTWLPQVLTNPEDLHGRGQLLYAAMLSGVVISQSGTTLVHGMGYYYTLDHGTAHGVANALLLPPLFWWNAHHAADKVSRLASALGHPCAATPSEAAQAITDALYELYEKINFNPSAKEHGIPESALGPMAADIVNDPYRFKNQVGVLNVNHVEALFRASWAGSVGGLLESASS